MFTTATDAYTTTGPDSVVNLAAGWHQAEYNVIGDGEGSRAAFNAGSQIGVKIALTDGELSCRAGGLMAPRLRLDQPRRSKD